jgi:hypothetical protein
MRAPDPMSQCRPGGTCPECNPPPMWCQGCLAVKVENKDDLCPACEAEREADSATDDDGKENVTP